MHIIYTVGLKICHSQLADIVDMMTPMLEPLLSRLSGSRIVSRPSKVAMVALLDVEIRIII